MKQDWGIQRCVLIMEKIRKLWDEMREHPFWLAFGIYIGMATEQWLGCLKGYVLLERVLFFTFGAPLLLFSAYYIRKPEHHMTSRKIIIVGGAVTFGFPIWLFLVYVLYTPTWAPFHSHRSILNTVAIILTTVLSYGGAAYLVDRLGRRGYWPGVLKVCGILQEATSDE